MESTRSDAQQLLSAIHRLQTWQIPSCPQMLSQWYACLPQDTGFLLQAVFDYVVANLLVHGTVSLRALRMQLQDIVGANLTSCRLAIRKMAEMAVCKMEHDGWNMSCMRDGSQRGMSLLTQYHDETNVTATWSGFWEPLGSCTQHGRSRCLCTRQDNELGPNGPRRRHVCQ